MQSHFFAEHAGHENIQFDLVNQHNNADGEPELGRAHAQRDQQNGNGNEKCANVRKKLAKEREHAEDECRLYSD